MIRGMAERLGAQLKRIGPHEYASPCPTCGGRDRFSINTSKDVWNCRGCEIGGDAIDLARHVLGISFNEARQFVTGEGKPSPRRADSPKPRPEPRCQDDGREERTASALALWRESADPRGTLVETYLRFRKLELGEDTAGEVLRWNARLGAMIALFRNIKTDEPQAVSRIFLDRDGRKIGRKFLGPVGGAAIKLDSDDTVLGGLHIGEGVETCLAARQLGFRPAWALGSAGSNACFPVLNGIEALTILAENDEANSRAAEQVGERWTAAGCEVLLALPVTDSDLNDALKRRAGA